MKSVLRLKAWPLICVLLISLGTTVRAQDIEPTGSVDGQTLTGSFTLYGWYTFVDGQVGAGGLGPVTIGGGDSDLFDILDGFFMANGDLQYGRFGFYGDLLYVSLSDSNRVFGWEFDGVAFTGAATYALIDTPESRLQAVAGIRYWNVEAGVDILPPAGPSASRDRDWVDFIGGLRGRHALTPNWYVEGTALAGAGGSDFIWDLYGGFGYLFTPNFSGTLGYRGMGLDYSSGGTVIDVTFHGPVAGLTLRF